MFTSTLLYAGLLPAATAAVVTLMAARARLSPSAIWANGTAAGVIAGLFGLKSRAGLVVALRAFAQPSEAADWGPLIVLLAWGITMLWLAAPPNKRRYVLVIAAIFLVAVPLQLLSGNVRLAKEWSTPDKLAGLATLAAVLGVTWCLLAVRDHEHQSMVKLSLIVVTTIASALVLTFAAHVFVYGEACGTLAAALTGTALACFLGATGSASATHPHQSNGLSGAAAPIAFTLGSYLILGRFFADLGTLNAVLLLASLIAAGGPLPRPLAQRSGWQPIALRLTTCLVPLSLALASTLN